MGEYLESTGVMLSYARAILLPLTQIQFVFVSCVQRRVVRGSGVGSGGCLVHIDVHGE